MVQILLFDASNPDIRFERVFLKPTLTVSQIAKKHGKKVSYIENQLEIGTKHELEHTYDSELAKKTALHHLAEMADYYTRLKRWSCSRKLKNSRTITMQVGRRIMARARF